jgi:hypothetical protein
MSKIDITFIPHVVINPKSIVSYSEVIFETPHVSKKNRYIDPDLKPDLADSFLMSKRTSEGKVSNQAKRKISKAIEYLVTVSKEKKVLNRLTDKIVVVKLSFLTLTLPSKQIHTDKEIINTCLNSFLNEVRKYHSVHNYIWRAELQKNGNIHFHLLSDAFIPWWDARNRWNRIVNKLGYVDRFTAKHGHTTPNSTDIHSTRKIKNIQTYLCKYMVKDEQKSPSEITEETRSTNQTGRIWGCNHELSQTRGLNLVCDSELNEELRKVCSSSKCHKYESTYFTVFYVDYHEFVKCGSNLLFKYFSDYLIKQLGFYEQLNLN